MSAKNVADASGPVLVLGHFLLNDLPAIVTVIGGLLSIAWYVVRFYDRYVDNQKALNDED